MVCKKCNNPDSEFYDYSKNNCKECEKKRLRPYNKSRDRTKTNKQRRDVYNPEKQAICYRLSNYRITQKQYQQLIDAQKGKCYLCLNEDRPLCIDHDHHQCGHLIRRKGCSKCIRGLLCEQCNRRHLPWVEKNERLQSDIVKEYLKRRPLSCS